AIRTTGRHPGATARRKRIGALHPDRLTRAQLRFADHRLRRQFDLFDGLLEGRQHRQWKSQMGNRHLRYLAWGCTWLNQRRRNVKMSNSGRNSPGFNGIEKYEWGVVGHGIDLQPVVDTRRDGRRDGRCRGAAADNPGGWCRRLAAWAALRLARRRPPGGITTDAMRVAHRSAAASPGTCSAALYAANPDSGEPPRR